MMNEMFRVLIGSLLGFMIAATVVGNTLVVLAVLVYKRMQTFPNLLLTSLAISDLLVGALVTPLALVDMLHGHLWPFGEFLCNAWATMDILLCTSSILNLCIINLDRYFAITQPLRYTRSRSSKLALKLIAVVWGLSLLICSPPWIIPQWKMPKMNTSDFAQPFVCGYTKAVSFRIYSAMGSFFIPLIIIIFVYSKIFRIVNQREKYLARQCQGGRNSHQLRICYSSQGNHSSTISELMRASPFKPNDEDGKSVSKKASTISQPPIFQPKSILKKPKTDPSISKEGQTTVGKGILAAATVTYLPSLEAEEAKTINARTQIRVDREDSPISSESEQELSELLPKSSTSFESNNEFRKKPKSAVKINIRTTTPAKERSMFMRERKTLKTIGIVVSGFILCWLPFFTLYIIEICIPERNINYEVFGAFGDIFLWLGYSNSALNPLVYTFYNRDFRRCFKDILKCGCCFFKNSSRSQSVRRLHQSVALV